jgi:hypothetical protein
MNQCGFQGAFFRWEIVNDRITDPQTRTAHYYSYILSCHLTAIPAQCPAQIDVETAAAITMRSRGVLGTSWEGPAQEVCKRLARGMQEAPKGHTRGFARGGAKGPCKGSCTHPAQDLLPAKNVGTALSCPAVLQLPTCTCTAQLYCELLFAFFGLPPFCVAAPSCVACHPSSSLLLCLFSLLGLQPGALAQAKLMMEQLKRALSTPHNGS